MCGYPRTAEMASENQEDEEATGWDEDPPNEGPPGLGLTKGLSLVQRNVLESFF